MSELIKLANSLRQLSDEQIANICRIRSASVTGCKDFFDLAEVINKPQAIQKALLFVSKANSETLIKIANQEPVPAGLLENLYAAALVHPASNEVYPSVLAELRKLVSEQRVKTATAEETDSGAVPSGLSANEVDRDAAIAAFEIFQNLRALIYDVIEFGPKMVGKNSLGLNEAKRLAMKTGQDVEIVKQTFLIAQELMLVEITSGNWSATEYAKQWLELSDAEKLFELVRLWASPLDNDAKAELEQLTHPVKVADWLNQCFPFAKSGLAQVLTQLETRGDLLGITARGYLTSATRLLLLGNRAGALTEAENCLPKSQPNVILQSDLSVVAPGPLSFELERELLKFAEIENLGLASRYRLNLISVIRGFEAGLDVDAIEQFLGRIALTPIPQPILYLLRDAQTKYRSIKISGRDDALITCSTELISFELLGDSRLRQLSLKRISNTELQSRFPAEVVWRSLRELGLPASLVTDRGQPEDASSEKFNRNVKVDRLLDQIAKIRRVDLEFGSSQDDDDISRQIQLAMKHRAKVKVGAQTRDGKIVYFTLEPKSLANGRFRGMDKQADIERTLPLASIRSVEIA